MSPKPPVKKKWDHYALTLLILDYVGVVDKVNVQKVS